MIEFAHAQLSPRRRNRDRHLARQRSGFARARITHAALFGSRARAGNTQDSDIDILIETDPEVLTGVYGYAAIKAAVAALF